VENCKLKTELRGPRARIDQATAGFERPRVAITLALPHLRHRSLLTNCAIEQAKVDGLLSQAKAWREAAACAISFERSRSRSASARRARIFGLG
jgi:hypothetical protein